MRTPGNGLDLVSFGLFQGNLDQNGLSPGAGTSGLGSSGGNQLQSGAVTPTRNVFLED